MRRAIAWFASNGVAANTLVFLVLGGGLLTLPRIRKEIFPEISLDRIRITIPYPGAAPAEVEEAVCVRVEASAGPPSAAC
jgi:multidrug efflux pump subunit AcrB